MNPTLIAATIVLGAGVTLFLVFLRVRGMDRWFLDYVLQSPRRWREKAKRGEVHLLIAVADHFEPMHKAKSALQGQARIDRWAEVYPRIFGSIRDRDGRPPQHTFFYPVEQYDENHVEALAALCRAGFGEVEVHLHHDNDTAENLRAVLTKAKEILARRHGLLAVRRDTGEVAYGFVHGNWCLDNSRPDGRSCGVNNEIDVLRETGCYADFTMPSAPGPSQTRTINSIYYAVDDPDRPMSHDRGIPIGRCPAPDRGLLMIQGPLVLLWKSRKWGIVPRIENGCIQGSFPASIGRVDNWLRAGVSVPSRPDWVFVKLHAHGAHEAGQAAILGETMVQFHQALAAKMEADPTFHVHYVTAREMYNLARAAEAGWAGSVAEARDYELIKNPASPTVRRVAAIADHVASAPQSTPSGVSS